MKRSHHMSATLAALALASCALLESPPVEAATVTVTWSNPATNTDDSPIPADGAQAGSLQTWRVEYGTCLAGGAFGTKAGEVLRTRLAGGPELTTAVLNLNPATVCTRVLVANTYSVESAPSNVVTRVVAPPQPRPPVQSAGS